MQVNPSQVPSIDGVPISELGELAGYVFKQAVELNILLCIVILIPLINC